MKYKTLLLEVIEDNQQLLLIIEYLSAENRVLKKQLNMPDR